MRIKIDTSEIVQAQKALEALGDAARPLIAKSLNRSTQGVRTDASRMVRQRYNIRAKDVRTSFKIITASREGLSAAAIATGSAISLWRFGPRPATPGRRPRIGVSVKVTQTRQKIPGAFVARMPSGGIGVFQRKDRARLPIKKLYGPSVPQMLSHDQVLPEIQSGAADRFNKTLDHEIDFYLRKKGLQ
jgi:hypothetical protein